MKVKQQTIIIGLGPSGLETAHYLLDKMQILYLVDINSNPFYREQQLALDANYIWNLFYSISPLYDTNQVRIKLTGAEPNMQFVIDGLDTDIQKQHPVDFNFFQDLIASNGIVSVKDLQNYLFTKLQEKISFMRDNFAAASNLHWHKKLTAISAPATPIYLLTFLFELREKLTQHNLYVSGDPKFAPIAAELEKLPLLNQLVFQADPVINYQLFGVKKAELRKQLLAMSAKISASMEQMSDKHQEIFALTIEDCFVEFTNYLDYALNVFLEATVENIDALTGTATITQNGKALELNPNFIIDAEGTKRTTLNQISNLNFQTIPLPTPRPEQLGFGSVWLHLKRKNLLTAEDNPLIAPLLPESSKLTRADLSTLQTVGWTQNYLPLLYIQYFAQTNQFFIVGEMPNQFLDLKESKEQISNIREFLIKVLTLEYPQLRHDDFAAISPPDCQIFPLTPSYVQIDDRIVGKTIVLPVGDAHMSANILFGGNMLGASQDAQSVCLCFNELGDFISLNPYMNNTSVRTADYYAITAEQQNFLYFYERPALLKVVSKVDNASRVLADIASTFSWAYQLLTRKKQASANEPKKKKTKSESN